MAVFHLQRRHVLPFIVAILLLQVTPVDVYQGQAVILKLSSADCAYRPEVFGKRYQCTDDNRLVVGVDLAQNKGQYPVIQDGRIIAVLNVVEREWPVEYWTTRPGKAVSPEKREREAATIRYALSAGEQKYFTMRLSPPLLNPLHSMPEDNGNFGVRRVYRNARTGKVVSESRHRGADLPTDKRPALVKAIGRGVVVLADKFSAEGNMVIVYHGSGVYSLSMHLSRISVRKGQYLDAGDTLGFSGATGSARGIHLHLTVKDNGATVDPLQFIELLK